MSLMDMVKRKKQKPCNSHVKRARKLARQQSAAERKAKYDAIPLAQRLALPNRGAKETARIVAALNKVG